MHTLDQLYSAMTSGVHRHSCGGLLAQSEYQTMYLSLTACTFTSCHGNTIATIYAHYLVAALNHFWSASAKTNCYLMLMNSDDLFNHFHKAKRLCNTNSLVRIVSCSCHLLHISWILYCRLSCLNTNSPLLPVVLSLLAESPDLLSVWTRQSVVFLLGDASSPALAWRRRSPSHAPPAPPPPPPSPSLSPSHLRRQWVCSNMLLCLIDVLVKTLL